MSKHKYLPGGTALFEDDSDEDSDGASTFRSRIPHYMPKTPHKAIKPSDVQTQQKIQKIQQDTLASAERSLKLLQATESIGIQAAQELAVQGEKLHNTGSKLDQIDANLKESQKHINGIKSVYHGIVSYIAGKSRSPSPCRRALPQKRSPKSKALFYTNGDAGALPNTSKLQNESMQSSVEPNILKPEKALEESLQQMSAHLTQLKGIGLEIGKEIEHQNEYLDVLLDKVDNADIKLGEQNKQMNNILRK